LIDSIILIIYFIIQNLTFESTYLFMLLKPSSY